MVLFTSQEDMIIGKSCQIHHKEARYKTASGFNSKTDLFNTTLDYDAEKVCHVCMYLNGFASHSSTVAGLVGHLRMWELVIL